MVLNLRQLQYLCTLAETGSYHTAARKLYITQPTLSIAVKKLEERLHQPLFIRQSKQVVPTEAGELVLASAREMLALDRELEGRLQALQENRKDRLRIGTYLIFSALLMPTLMTQFHKSHPQVELRLQHRHYQELIQDLARNQFDLILCFQDAPNPDFVCRRLRQEGFLVVLPADHPLCQKARPLPDSRFPYLPGELLKEETFLLQSHSQQIRLQEDKLLADLGKIPRTREIENIETAVHLAAGGMGIAFCMESYTQAFHTSKPVRYFRTGDPARYPWLTICYKKEKAKSKNLLAFVDLIQKTVEEIL